MQLTISVPLLVVLFVSISTDVNASPHHKTSLTVLDLPEICVATDLELMCGETLVGRLQKYCLDFYQSKRHNRFKDLISRSKRLKGSKLCRKQVKTYYTNIVNIKMSNFAAWSTVPNRYFLKKQVQTF